MIYETEMLIRESPPWYHEDKMLLYLPIKHFYLLRGAMRMLNKGGWSKKSRLDQFRSTMGIIYYLRKKEGLIPHFGKYKKKHRGKK